MSRPAPLSAPLRSPSDYRSRYPHSLWYHSLLSAVDLAKRAQSDPLHALIPVFAHPAFSEVAFLNLVHALLDKLTEPQPLDNFHNETFESLLHLKIIRERHADQIRHSIRSIQVLGERSEFFAPHNTRHRRS